MGEKLNKFLELDIPEELYLARNIQTMMARAAVADAPPEEAAMAVLSIAVGNLMELEQRVVTLEKQAGVTPPKPRDMM
ncbi:hypothetical protein [Mycolicibacterium tusciae]|uniref:Uncharacterized protein n=1 Tax=Mycolicibacterium tusciae TaxID=75922 RepID=A0A1X0JXR2_9MYCO|nr:hypothetical protein [Mycolicibacterium tusciae]ORB67693.1 hypothetical protein BST47_04235 [Mycolicibacterium tusciae]